MKRCATTSEEYVIECKNTKVGVGDSVATPQESTPSAIGSARVFQYYY